MNSCINHKQELQLVTCIENFHREHNNVTANYTNLYNNTFHITQTVNSNISSSNIKFS